jgi:hypothetical protein
MKYLTIINMAINLVNIASTFMDLLQSGKITDRDTPNKGTGPASMDTMHTTS